MFYNKLITLLLLAGCTLITAVQLDDLKKPATEIIGHVVTDATAKTTITTTMAPKTTTSTTVAPTTTTSSTTPPPPTTTTVAPTTTTAAPSTTPAPAPYSEPSVGAWNSSCIMVKMAAQLNFTYETNDNGFATKLYNLPSDAKVEDSDCTNNNTQTITINWGPSNAIHALTMQFDRTNNTAQLTMMLFSLPLTSDSFPNAKDNQTIQLLHRGKDFGSPLRMSYHCTRTQRLNFTETVDKQEVIGYAMLHDVQTEAFRDTAAKGFSEAHDCDSSETSDIVPIAVGIALAMLILIVLVSYLCARRRSTSRGYMSF